MTAKDRVKEELNELNQKIEKLGNLLGKVKSENWTNHADLLQKLSNEQKKLLKKQYAVMKSYARILKKRLDIWVDEP